MVHSLSRMCIGGVTRGFELQAKRNIPELNLVGYTFLHEKTKATYYHLAADDSHNSFCLGFCTPNPNHKGVPHILEHTTLCGSDKFPVRDPFFHMTRRSLATFMNAMTGTDYTMYPFSTVNAADFRNLLRVYLDAVFNPLLREMDFLQEGHRIEKNEDDKLCIKGVVYNEMKGSRADPSNYFFSQLMQYALVGTSYANILGGCPKYIPDLLHSELVQFHQQHYHPSNVTCVSYGNLCPVENMDLLDDVFSKFSPSTRVAVPFLEEKLVNTNPSKPMVVEYGPPDATDDPTKCTRILLSWAVPTHYYQGSHEEILRNIVELDVLSTLLTDGPASPMYKALIDSHLGSDYAPGCGITTEFRNALFSFGVQGVDYNHITEKEVSQAVLTALESAAKDGFSESRVEGILHQASLSRRHRGKKFGLQLCMGTTTQNIHQMDVLAQLETGHIYNAIGQRHKEDTRCFTTLIKNLFLSRPPQVTLVVHADPKHNEKLAAVEKIRTDNLEHLRNSNVIQSALEKAEGLKKFQMQEPNVSVLPTLRVCDIPDKVDGEPLGKLHNVGKNTIEVIITPCNQLIYTNVFIPLSISEFSPEELSLLPVYAAVLTDVGTESMDYEALSVATRAQCSGFSCEVHLDVDPDLTKMLFGIYLNFYALPEKYDTALKLLEDILGGAKFDHSDDKVRTQLYSLLCANASGAMQSIPRQGHVYAMTSAASLLSQPAAVANKIEGLAQVEFQRTIREKLVEFPDGEKRSEYLTGLIQKLRILHEKVCLHSMQLWGICEAEQEAACLSKLQKFCHQLSATSTHTKNQTLVGSNTLENYGLLQQRSHAHYIDLPGEVGYAAMAIPTSLSLLNPESAPLQVGLRILSNEFLHNKVREQGGAYGSGATLSPSGLCCGITGMYSYRDPTPMSSLTVMQQAAHFLSAPDNVGERQVQEALLGLFGSIDAPRTPQMYGRQRYLRGLDDEKREAMRRRLLQVTVQDVVQRVPKILRAAETARVVLGDPQQKPQSEEWDCSKW